MTEDRHQFDIVIVGAGPAGLCFAASVQRTGLRVALVEQLDEAALSEPHYDGREIALTLKSVDLLARLGLWRRIPESERSPLRGARVRNGDSADALQLRPFGGGGPDLGYLVSNHVIRRAAYENVRDLAGPELLAATRVETVATDERAAQVRLSDGRTLTATLVVAADTRFSATRRAMGIPARQEDFGKTMLVCRMQHERPHDHVACEWFGHHQTLALLPLNGQRSSVVLTLRHVDVERLRALPAEEFARDVERRLAGALGRMVLDSERFAYPLVAVYPRRFAATRYVTIGDAAVGMHPVTAHGFNFGLAGQDTLARLIGAAASRQADIGAASLLARYDAMHRLATRPLYLATNAVVRLYTDDSLPARILRGALLGVASRTPPVASLLSGLLMQRQRPSARLPGP